MKQSAAEMAAAVLWPLRQSKEVVHKDINILEELGVLSNKVRVPRQGTKLFVEAWGRFNPNSLSTFVQFVRQRLRVCAQSLICQVCNCLCVSAKYGRRVLPAHGQGQWDRDQIFLASLTRKNEALFCGIGWAQTNPVKTVSDIDLYHVYRSQFLVGVHDFTKQTI